jgi:hypothetical protein
MAELFAAANGGAPTWQVITQKGLVMLDGRTCAPR